MADSFKKPTTASSLFVDQVTTNRDEFERYRMAVNDFQKENDYELVANKFSVSLNDVRYIIITTEKLRNAT